MPFRSVKQETRSLYLVFRSLSLPNHSTQGFRKIATTWVLAGHSQATLPPEAELNLPAHYCSGTPRYSEKA